MRALASTHVRTGTSAGGGVVGGGGGTGGGGHGHGECGGGLLP